MRLILYTRVSSAEQAKGGISLDAQEARGRGWADAMGHEIVSVAQDEGVSASNAPLARPNFRNATIDLQRGLADGLVACALDRIARSVIDTLELIDLFGRHKWALMSLNESLDTSNAIGRLLVTVLSGFAEFERNRISERTQEAMDEMRRQNRMCAKVPPFGKREIPGSDGMLEDDEIEVECLRRIVDFRSRGVSAPKIAEELNKWRAHPRTALPWTRTSVENMTRRLLRLGISRIRHHKTLKSPVKPRATLPPVP